MIRCGVLTVSDRCSAGEAEDKSGPALIKLLEGQEKYQYKIEETKVIPDEKSQIEAVLRHWSDMQHLDLVLTTGGTGFAPRDVTPEATKSVLDSEAPGIIIAMMTASLNITPMAMLSRAIAGVRGQTLIVNLPGSPKGATENAVTALKAIPHAIALLKGDIGKVEKVHQKLHCGCSHKQEESDITQVAYRPRKSPYPMISVEEALKFICNETETLLQAVEMPIYSALDCISAEDAVSVCNIPPYEASIKDGYAVLSADGAGEREVVGDVLAGASFETKSIKPGQCLRITTGAAVCGGADAVVQVEDTELLLSTPDGKEELKIKIIDAPRRGQDIRPVGSDLAVGQVVVEKGNKIGPAQIGALASAGIKKIMAYRRPKVAVFSTGDEIQDISSTSSSPYVIYDSNRPTLIALLTQQGFQVEDMGIARDDPDVLADTLKKSFAGADVVISSGGVSMGEKDYLKQILIKNFQAKIHFGRVNMKPGKPTTFATCELDGRKKLVFALPGNPVSATVTCHLFALTALRALSGFSTSYNREITVQLAEDIILDPRPEYCRAVLEKAPAPTTSVPLAHLTGNQISSRLLSLQSGSVLIELPGGTKERQKLLKGELLKALLIE